MNDYSEYNECNTKDIEIDNEELSKNDSSNPSACKNRAGKDRINKVRSFIFNTIELATLRAKFMDRYNEVMGSYQSEHNITYAEIDKIHDKNLLLSDKIPRIFHVDLLDIEDRILKLYDIYSGFKLTRSNKLRYSRLILAIVNSIDHYMDNNIEPEEV